MAGSNSGFSAAEFNEAIHFVMEMAAPTSSADTAKFYFAPTLDPEDVSAAPDGVPFNAANEPDGRPKAPVSVPCAVESIPAADEGSHLGLIRPSRLSVTVLDLDYQKIRGCAYMVLGGERYDYRAADPPTGLFDAGIWTLHFVAFKDL